MTMGKALGLLLLLPLLILLVLFGISNRQEVPLLLWPFDLALVVRSAGPLSRVRVRAVRALTRRRCGPGPADRLSVFWARWRDVHHGAAGRVRLPAVDRLDLIEHGRLLAGTDRRAGAVVPTHEELVLDGARFAVGWYDEVRLTALRDPVALAAAGVPLAVCLLVVMLLPWVSVVGWELKGHRDMEPKLQRTLAALRLRG